MKGCNRCRTLVWILGSALLVLAALSTPVAAQPPQSGTVVRVHGVKGSWSLLVNGQQFRIKGVGCGQARGKSGVDFLKLARDLGANAVRTWGIDQGTPEYFDLAADYGLLVNAGIWLNIPDAARNISYARPGEFIAAMRQQALDYVAAFKDHPALLMWNVGNEVLIFSSEEERIAFCHFLEALIQDIKRIDPHHPVIYAAADPANIRYIRHYVPSLDIFGVNVYGSVRAAHGVLDSLESPIPYVVTEFGPRLPLDSPKDKNNRSQEPDDRQKAISYRNHLRALADFNGYNLGGFAFHLGETSQESMTWWNMNHDEYKRASYWQVYQAYTGNSVPKPLIMKNMQVSKVQGIKPGEWIEIRLDPVYFQTESVTIDVGVSTSTEGVLAYYVNEYVAIPTIIQDNQIRLQAPIIPGMYRVYAFARDAMGTVSSLSSSIEVVAD